MPHLRTPLSPTLFALLLAACGGSVAASRNAEEPATPAELTLGKGAPDPLSADGAGDEKPEEPSRAAQTSFARAKLRAPLDLQAVVSAEGISLSTSSGGVAPGCEALGPGVTVPRAGKEHDYVKLTACVARIKLARPEFESEDEVTLIASPDTDYQTVIKLIDALRAEGDKELFPSITFRAVR